MFTKEQLKHLSTDRAKFEMRTLIDRRISERRNKLYEIALASGASRKQAEIVASGKNLMQCASGHYKTITFEIAEGQAWYFDAIITDIMSDFSERAKYT